MDIIAEMSRRSVEEIKDHATLGDDLDLDSLGRVELLSAIETELGVYLDESNWGPRQRSGSYTI